jgi:Fe2+ or Zn2+ uptake regulation protein
MAMSRLQAAVYALLRNNRGHFTAEQILIELRREHPTASLATVYRTLDIFTREGKIRRVLVPDGSGCYEGNLAPHDHAVCVHCGRITDFTVPGLAKLTASNIDGELVSLDLIVKYVCSACMAKP